MLQEQQPTAGPQGKEDNDFNSRRYWGKVALSGAVGGTIAFLAKKAEASPVVALARHISSSGLASEPATDGLDLKNNDGFTGELNQMDVRLFRKLIPGPDVESKRALLLWDDVKTFDGDLLSEITKRHSYSEYNDSRGDWRFDPAQLPLVNNTKDNSSIDPSNEVSFPYPWSKENSKFLHNYLLYMNKFFNSLLGKPSEEMSQWLGNKPYNVPIFPYPPSAATDRSGFAHMPPVNSPPNTSDFPYGLYAEFNPEKTDPSFTSVDIVAHEALHVYIGLKMIPKLEAKGYGEWGHNLMENIWKVIRAEGFGYSFRDDRATMSHSIAVVRPSNAHSSYNILKREDNPLLWDYQHGNKRVFRDALET